jgi:hypothetical protein
VATKTDRKYKRERMELEALNHDQTLFIIVCNHVFFRQSRGGDNTNTLPAKLSNESMDIVNH